MYLESLTCVRLRHVMTTTIATVTYKHGSDNGPDNRQLDFIRTGSKGTLYAKVTTVGLPKFVLGTIPETCIDVEMESTTEKTQKTILEQHNTLTSAPAPNQLLSQFSSTVEQDNILKSINANSTTTGGRWIRVKNDPSKGLFGEKVIGVTITDPR